MIVAEEMGKTWEPSYLWPSTATLLPCSRVFLSSSLSSFSIIGALIPVEIASSSYLTLWDEITSKAKKVKTRPMMISKVVLPADWMYGLHSDFGFEDNADHCRYRL
jgi:hypothetical protein